MTWIAGVDEAGRGCLAGPVAAAAVILPPDLKIPDINDSKLLTARERERLFPIILQAAVAWKVAFVPPDEIDRINIHRASLKAMGMAVTGLDPGPEFVLVDGRFRLPVGIPQKPIIDGDALSQSIAAASIVAKVSRDRWMTHAARVYAGFRFDRHKGYGTAAHRDELKRLGLTPLHRRSFRIF